MADVTLIPDGTTETQFTQAAGDLLILAAGDLLNVEGAPAVELEEPNTALLNDGAITASGAPAVLGDEASVRIVNGGGDPAASITSDDSAILLAPLNGATQEITNLGTIDGAFNGVDFQGAAGSSSKLFNAGLVTSESRALNIVADDVQVVNQGTFETTADPRNGVFYTDTQADATTLVNGADGVIDAGAGNDGDAVSLQVGNDVDLSVSNAGVFQGRGEPEGGGEASGLRILPGTEPNPGFNGTLLNKGLIASEATTGVGAGVLVEDGIDADGQLVNQGRITGPFNGLYLGDGDYADFVVFNGANGLITSASRAVNIDGDGLTLVNAGEISHTGDARNGVVYADDTADGYSISNTATGRIDAGEGLNGDAISLQLGDEVHADITNAGHVLGRGEAVLSGLASGVRLFSGAEDGSSIFRGEIDNSGRITSEATTGISAGILVEDGVSFRGEIHNSGEIAGPFNGIYIGDSDHELTLTNAEGGRISSDSRAVNIGGDGVTLINHGEILGTGDSRNGVVYSDDESNLFEVVNTSTGVIDAGKGNDGHAVSVELAVRSEGLIDNAGLLFGRGDSAGIRLFSNPETAGPDGSVFAGQILSEGTIRTEGGPGILIEENVAVRADGDDAAVVITGDVIADLALDATAMTTGLVFTQALGHIAGDLRFGAGDDDVTIADADLGGGGSVDGEIHLGAGDDSLDALDAESDLEVEGGTGDDEILTGAGDDIVATGSGDDRVFSGAGDDIVLGGDGDDAIDGGAGFDTLAGGDGDDELFGGAGLDLVSGGDGADIFFFAPISDIDVITDFDADEGDVIDLTLFETFASGDAAYAAGSDVGGDAVWDFGDGNTLTLANTDYAALSGDDFIV